MNVDQRNIWRFLGWAGLVVCTAAGLAQQPAGPGGPGKPVKVLIAGENPGLRLLDKEGGKALTSVNFWRAQWSPVGVGVVCFVTVSGPAEKLRIAITDNAQLADYVANKLMGNFKGPQRLNDPPYQVIEGTVTQTNVGTSQRTETCKSRHYKVEIVWKDLGEPAWVPQFRPGGGSIVQSFVMVEAKGGEVLVNGRKAPGTYYPTGGGFGPGAYLTLNEVWRQEADQ